MKGRSRRRPANCQSLDVRPKQRWMEQKSRQAGGEAEPSWLETTRVTADADDFCGQTTPQDGRGSTVLATSNKESGPASLSPTKGASS